MLSYEELYEEYRKINNSLPALHDPKRTGTGPESRRVRKELMRMRALLKEMRKLKPGCQAPQTIVDSDGSLENTNGPDS